MLIFSRIVFWAGLIFLAGCGIFVLIKKLIDKKNGSNNYK